MLPRAAGDEHQRVEVRPLTQGRLTHDQLLVAQDLASAVIRQAYEDARDADEHEGVLRWLNSRWFEWWCDVAGIDCVPARRLIGARALDTARRLGIAVQWLQNKLAGGSIPVPEAARLAQREIGIDKRMLRTAARKLGVRRVKIDGVWMWRMPNERGDANEAGAHSA